MDALGGCGVIGEAVAAGLVGGADAVVEQVATLAMMGFLVEIAGMVVVFVMDAETIVDVTALTIETILTMLESKTECGVVGCVTAVETIEAVNAKNFRDVVNVKVAVPTRNV